MAVMMNRGMNKPRIFLGSSGKQANLLQAITRGLEDVADAEPRMTTFNPGRSTLDRLVELSQEVDFAAFVFAQDDWTTTDVSQSGLASPRDNVVFEAGLFDGALGIRRTFILHANGSKLPSDLLGLTAVRYDPATSAADARSTRSSARRSRPRVAAALSRGCGGSSPSPRGAKMNRRP
jgi:predicted nucleotide-binding protein